MLQPVIILTLNPEIILFFSITKITYLFQGNKFNNNVPITEVSKFKLKFQNLSNKNSIKLP